MHLPSMLPDELLEGYIGRVRLINCLESNVTALRALRDLLRDTGDTTRTLSPTLIAAKLCGIDPRHVASAHTMTPAQRLVVIYSNPIEHGDPASAGSERLLPCIPHGQWPRFCPACVEEDLSFWGVAYWRRSHQMRGVDWCTKHEESLRASLDRRALDHPPGHGERSCLMDATQHLMHPAVRRFVEIYETFLDRRAPMPAAQARFRLRQIVLSTGLVAQRDYSHIHLRDQVFKAFPEEWLTRHFSPSSHLGTRRGRVQPSVWALDDGGDYAAQYALELAAIHADGDCGLSRFLAPLDEVERLMARGCLRAASIEAARTAGRSLHAAAG